MISLEWVSDYIDISDEDLEELAVKVTRAGINVERVLTNKINNLVVGEVIDCEEHPDSDHLHVCQVKISKDEVVQIVCGAPNVRAGLKVIVALPGAILPGDFEIKKSKIRGVNSNGMICALFELGLEEKTEENYNKGICELDEKAPVGEDAIKYLGMDSTCYELDIHKHRNNDCYYHIGFAYEIAAILNKKVKLPNMKYKCCKDNIKDYFDIRVDSDGCKYYTAKMVRDVKVGESPEFIKKRLRDAGMRSINNVVDISNYVMLEFGQPLHFFDKDSLGDKILVRDAKDGEELVTLDGVKRCLNSKDIVITDGKRSVCLGGVMGGLNTEVTDNTKNILIEAAIFDGVRIRNTASRLNLKSEASIRYGKGLSYEYTDMAMDRACYLLEKYAGATILEGKLIHDELDKSVKIVEFYPEEVNSILGMEISLEDMKREIERLLFDYKVVDGKFVVTIPSRRLDIDANVNDIAEEIGRLYGYQNLVSTLPKVVTKRGEYKGEVKYRKLVSKRLRSLGLNEVKTYTLVSSDMASMFNYDKKEKVVLPNPMGSDKSIVRTSIIPSLINNYEYNRSRRVNDIFIYEISKTYDRKYNEDIKVAGLLFGKYFSNGWGTNIDVDFYVVKGIIEDILNYMGYNNRYSFVVSDCEDMHPGISADIILDGKKIGIIGRVHPRLLKDEVYVFEISISSLIGKIKPIKYKEVSKYPSIDKDMAFIIDKDIMAEDIIKTIKKAGGRSLKGVGVFDVYQGKNIVDNKKSIAFSLEFCLDDRTLTDEEVSVLFNKIIDEIKDKYKAILRDN